jgi:hypothetical protein
MIIKIQINKNTLEAIVDDCDCSVNYVKDENGIIEIEVSKPEPEINYPYINFEP